MSEQAPDPRRDPRTEEETAREDERKRGALRWLLAAAGLAVVVFIGVGLWLAYKPVPDQLQGMVDAESFTVATKVPLSRVEKLFVEAGQRVKAGQELVLLTSPELDARRDQAAGVLAGAEAVQARTLAGSRPENVETLRATSGSALAALQLAEKTYVRIRNLHDEGVVSTQRLDEARAARDAAAGNARAADQQYLRAVRGVPQEDKDAVAAQVEVARAGLQAVEDLQRETTLKAPVDAEVSHSMVRPGEVVALGFPIMTLVAVDHPWVSLNVRENQLHGLAAGRELSGRVPALDGRTLRFKVHTVSAQGEFATWRATRQSTGFDVRSFEVRLHPAEPVKELRPGMSVLFDWPQS
ncbi:HlyD family secretion protein [Variovorax sp. OV329]|uniref:HlyD family secretion protein n=1 Tax=Variovorax sp. OV329 TaxID=1882825 RepID=UPI0008E1379E|nr:efflux RND transporter periplasmic adaptor subunit [Variovorax sp. OV329]SFN37606.1 HlyD family secretion protein [Variovorax sp. OV329]